MNRESAVIVFYSKKNGIKADLEVPLFISASDLLIGLNTAYNLGIDTTDIKKCYIKSENPIALLKGNKSLAEFGIRTGSVLFYDEVN